MHSDYDVTNVMYGAETTAELDIYRGEPKPRLEPLLLDTVMQGQPRTRCIGLRGGPKDCGHQSPRHAQPRDPALELQVPNREETLSLFTLTTTHNLLINGALISEDFSLGPPMTPASWPLRSLVLMNVSNFFRTLFQLCSPTLESLAWETWNPEAWQPLSLGTDSKSFPKLQKLRIKPGRDAIDGPSFASFLSAPLKSLELAQSAFRKFEDFVLMSKIHTRILKSLSLIMMMTLSLS
ncbi:hypothetical protein F25303_4870 [Fusarium sp. NRRL 25303]|nr:hypothetical protein F25303_4870 [Fusarium sp. NRRL 25303]